MVKKIKYEGINKYFKINKQNTKFNKEIILVILSLIAIIFLVLAYILTKLSLDKNSHEINYIENTSISYKVCLFENSDYSDECIDESNSNTFLNNMINEIIINFDYESNFTEEVETKTTYSIIGEIILTKPNDNSAIILNRKYNISNNNTIYINEIDEAEKISIYNKDILNNINEEVVIDYQFFENYINEFRTNYQSSFDSKLIITIFINNTSYTNEIENQILYGKNMSIEIPLNEQFIQLEKGIETKNEESTFIASEKISLLNIILLILAIVFTITGLLLLLASIRKIYINIYKKDIYKYTIKKYLKEYDRLIITTDQPNINENNFKTKIRVMTIEELVDAHDNTGNPILYYEVIPDQKSYFIILDNLTIYKLTISREFLLKNKKVK